jgi:FKBP-type peptidyl-prolyl cis-trans isomerase
MEKTKIISIAGTAVTVLLLAGGGLWFWHSQGGSLHRNISSSDAAAVGQLSQSANEETSAEAQTSPSASSSLSVAGSANNLGQLGAAGSSSSQSSATGSSGGSSSQAKAPSPASYAEYDKYKDSQNALFGDIQVGNGDELTVNKKAAVYYKGYLTNGQLFDESKPGSDGKLQPFIFTLGAHQVVPGWEQGVAGMKVGGTRLIIVPPAVGYGAQGQGPVPANAVMVFEVQLVAVQ